MGLFGPHRRARIIHAIITCFLYGLKIRRNRANKPKIKELKNAHVHSNPMGRGTMAEILYPRTQPVEITLYELTCQAIARLALENVLLTFETAHPSFSRKCSAKRVKA